MHSRTVEQVRSWDSRPFDGGLEVLSALADDGHTGAVTAADTWLFMLNGRVIGVFEGEIEDFEASGTVFSTAADSLPLLFAMQERGGRTRAKYFTEDTPLREADETLSAANFTGYVELSENVLSGDYYLVYYGGTRREVAFVGQSERVETGEAAFDLAVDEVGIYEVKDVSMTITEIPAAASSADRHATAATMSGATETPQEAGERGSADDAAPDGVAETGPALGEASAEEPSTAVDQSSAASETEAEPTGDSAPAEGSKPADPGGQEPASAEAGASTPSRQSDSQDSEPTEVSSRRDSNRQGTEATPSDGDTTVPEEPSGDDRQDTGTDTATSELERRFQQEAEWRRTRTIPALDPEETHPTDGEAETDTVGSSTGEQSGRQSGSDSQQGRKSGSDSPSGRQLGSGSQSGRKSVRNQQPARSRLEKLRAAVEKRDARIRELQSRVETLESERSTLETDLAEAAEARESLKAELEALREEREELVARVEQAGDETAGSEETLSPEAALAGTNLFVRYDSKGQPTLADLGDADPEAIDANLRLEHHTQFETDAVTVEGQGFREFLESTGTYGVLDWLLRELPYELLETGNRNAMADLFDAIAAIDRIELEGAVTVDAEAGRSETFSFVLRDRMGNPLVVGEYDDDRDAVRESELQDLLSGAEGVATTSDQFAGALYVTRSFFEPDALELAESAASSGGLFSRGEKASYVSPADGTGFHLALVEDRSRSFHVTVPKL
ncbi:MAG: DUF7527 domain-containing protein [Halodesulfurarchaeum sp.]